MNIQKDRSYRAYWGDTAIHVLEILEVGPEAVKLEAVFYNYKNGIVYETGEFNIDKSAMSGWMEL